MMRSLFAGVSGLQNHQTEMDVIGNNIANVDTVAFKSSAVDVQRRFCAAASGREPSAGQPGRHQSDSGRTRHADRFDRHRHDAGQPAVDRREHRRRDPGQLVLCRTPGKPELLFALGQLPDRRAGKSRRADQRLHRTGQDGDERCVLRRRNGHPASVRPEGRREPDDDDEARRKPRRLAARVRHDRSGRRRRSATDSTPRRSRTRRTRTRSPRRRSLRTIRSARSTI